MLEFIQYSNRLGQEVSCCLAVAEFGLKAVHLVAAFSFLFRIVVEFHIVETQEYRQRHNLLWTHSNKDHVFVVKLTWYFLGVYVMDDNCYPMCMLNNIKLFASSWHLFSVLFHL